MWKAIRYDPGAAPMVSYDDVNRFVNIGIGALLVVLGNLMPKMRRNVIFNAKKRLGRAEMNRRCIVSPIHSMKQRMIKTDTSSCLPSCQCVPDRIYFG